MCSEAVQAYLKLGDAKAAVDTCVKLRQWGQATDLAQRFQMPEVGVLLNQHATQLLREDRLPEAIELQRKAGRHMDAARLLTKLAKREIDKNSSMLRIKKLYVLAGLMAEDHLKFISACLPDMPAYNVDRLSLIDTLSPEDANLVEHVWHCAEAYHFMLLAQRQLRFGIVRSAVETSLRLRLYDDVLNPEDVYSLLALACCADRSFETCSKALLKLESLDNLSEDKLRQYQELAVNIFAKNEPVDEKVEYIKCYACGDTLPDG